MEGVNSTKPAWEIVLRQSIKLVTSTSTPLNLKDEEKLFTGHTKFPEGNSYIANKVPVVSQHGNIIKPFRNLPTFSISLSFPMPPFAQRNFSWGDIGERVSKLTTFVKFTGAMFPC